MDATKQISTISLGKWVTFRRMVQSDQAFQSMIFLFTCFELFIKIYLVDVISSRQVARIVTTRSEDIKMYGNGVVYPISTILSGPARSAADELARSYQ